jgi:hypothetical protein
VDDLCNGVPTKLSTKESLQWISAMDLYSGSLQWISIMEYPLCGGISPEAAGGFLVYDVFVLGLTYFCSERDVALSLCSSLQDTDVYL